MEKGFFVLFKRDKAIKAKPVSWKSELLDPVSGWSPTTGATIGEAIEGQQQQYAARARAHESVPKLLSEKDFPMATGQTVRFVPIA